MAQWSADPLVAQAQDRRGLVVAGQEGGDVAVPSVVADDGLAEAGPAARDVGDDPLGDGGAGLRAGVSGTLSMMAVARLAVPGRSVSYLHMHRACELDGNVSESPRIRASSQLNRA